MTITELRTESESAGGRRVEPGGEKSRAPIKFWAGVGVAFLLLELYILVAWLLGSPTRTPIGNTPVPDWMRLAGNIWVVCGLLGLAATVYFFLVRPWKRAGHITLDGMLLIVCATLYWEDPVANMVVPFFTYNSMFWNVGSWAEHVPGWMAPNGGKLAEPELWTGPLYVLMVFLLVIGASGCMRKAKARWPGMGTLGLVSVCFGFLAVADLIIEPAWLRLGYYAYPGTIGALTLFRGHYYQFPIYEAFFFPMCMGGISLVHYYKNDRGETVAERGVETLKMGAKGKTWFRFLALVGIANVSFASYNLIILPNMFQDAWPKDITNRSYLVDNMCGPGTDYACPGPGVPIPRPDSKHMNPKGQLVGP